LLFIRNSQKWCELWDMIDMFDCDLVLFPVSTTGNLIGLFLLRVLAAIYPLIGMR